MQQLKRRRYYGYGGVVYKREVSNELVSCARELEELGRCSERY
jgi:hypothetical protein